MIRIPKHFVPAGEYELEVFPVIYHVRVAFGMVTGYTISNLAGKSVELHDVDTCNRLYDLIGLHLRRSAHGD